MNWLTQPLAWPDVAALWAALRSGRLNDWRDWPMWPTSALAACAAGLFAFSVLAVWLLWPSHALDTDRLMVTHQNLQAQMAAQQARVAALKTQAGPAADPVQALSAVQRQWPTPDQVQPVWMAMYLQAHKLGLQVASFKPEAAQTLQGFLVRPVAVRAQGSFAQMRAWSEALLQQPALWVPEKWTLTAQPTGLVLLDAVLHVYVRPDDAAPSGKRPVAEVVDAPTWNAAELSQGAVATDPFSRPPIPTPVSPPSPPQVLGDAVHPLRRWPLHDLAMVGSFASAGVPYALVQTPAGLFRVAEGDLLGTEGRQVVGLNEAGLQLRAQARLPQGRGAERLEGLSIRPASKP